MWNTSQDILFHDKDGFKNTMVHGWIWFHKLQINRSFSTNQENWEEEMKWISMDTPSRWDWKSFHCTCAAFAASLPVASSSCLYSFWFCLRTRLTADHKLSASCERQQHVTTRRKFVSVCCLFCFTCLHSTQCFHACWHVHIIHYVSCATPHGSRLVQARV